MIPQWIIEKKRDGLDLSREEIEFFIYGYTEGSIPDYQMAALAMAVYFAGMSFDEISHLTHTMMNSGSVVDTSSLTIPKVDKHSTGGIGDKISLPLAPLVAACGLAVPMISGRGLGITGGTLDKMESIPGYRADISESRFLEVLHECGCSIIGQTSSLAPADKKLYALRDVTGTVPSIPLITASIMCKKLAEGIDGLVLDVKVGRGAFMKTVDQARELASNMIAVGKAMDKGVHAILTDMNEPLGRSVGNAVEVVEAIETLKGRGPEDVEELVLKLGSHMLMLGGAVSAEDEGIAQLHAKIASGEALATFRKMIELQGGDPTFVDEPTRFTPADFQVEVRSDVDGYIEQADAETIGKAVLMLGGGRTKTTDTVDPAVGITHLCKRGEHKSRGDVLCMIHANSQTALEEVEAFVRGAFILTEQPVESASRVLETMS